MKKKVDIILVTYNQEPYIRQALDGVLMQHLDSDIQVRIIVADDCSTDNTVAIIRKHLGATQTTLDGGKNATVVYLPSDTNMGHVRNYQRAFAACEADYVAIIEGDDYWTSPSHIQDHINFLEAHKECVLTTRRPVWYYEDEQQFDMRENTNLNGAEFVPISISDEAYDNRITNLSSCVVRGEPVRGLNERIYTSSILDWAMYIDLYRFGLLYVLPGTSNVYRAKKSGIFSGLDEAAQHQARVQYLTDLANIFPKYASRFNQAKEDLLRLDKPKSKSRRFAECLLMPFAKCHRFVKKIKNVYHQLR